MGWLLAYLSIVTNYHMHRYEESTENFNPFIPRLQTPNCHCFTGPLNFAFAALVHSHKVFQCRYSAHKSTARLKVEIPYSVMRVPGVRWQPCFAGCSRCRQAMEFSMQNRTEREREEIRIWLRSGSIAGKPNYRLYVSS